jgi:hypothetical protein
MPDGIVYHRNLVQGTDEWMAARCGLLTASELHLIVTPTLRVAANDKVRKHLYELLAQRVSGFVERGFIADAMVRGWEDEAMARYVYSEKVAPVEEVGFVTNDEWGFTLGYSPDGLVGDDGLIECKSRCQKHQVETIIAGCMPDDYLIQAQAGLLISGRKWLDFISYSGGLPMAISRVHPDEKVQAAIVEAATEFERTLAKKLEAYRAAIADMQAAGRYFPTERREEEIMV